MPLYTTDEWLLVRAKFIEVYGTLTPDNESDCLLINNNRQGAVAFPPSGADPWRLYLNGVYDETRHEFKSAAELIHFMDNEGTAQQVIDL
jgi:hypothetical protein